MLEEPKKAGKRKDIAETKETDLPRVSKRLQKKKIELSSKNDENEESELSGEDKEDE